MILDIKVLAGLEPFASLSSVRLREILGYCHSETVPKGNIPFEMHDLEGQSVYLVDGELELIYQDCNRVTVNAHTEWARHPLGKHRPYIASALALRESQLLRVDSELLDQIVTLNQYSQLDSESVVPSKGKTPANMKRLLSSGMFSADSILKGPLAHLPTSNISALLQHIEVIAVWEGDVIIREGDDGDYYYLIDNGRVQVTRCVGGVDMQLAILKAGDVFGEEALIADVKRNATVTMKSNGILWRIGRQDFLNLLQEPLLHKVTYEQALQAVAQGAVWLDVRYPSEYRHDKLPGAVNVPLNDIRSAIDVLGRDNKYIVYCQTGRRSAAAAFIMAQAGYDVQVLEGGLWFVANSACQ